ncbi:MAG: protein kinase, partial [Chloroflexota bacterium]
MTQRPQPNGKQLSYILSQIGAEQGYILDFTNNHNFTFYLKLRADGSPIETKTDLIIPEIAKSVLQKGQTVIIRNAMTDNRFANEWDVMRLKIRSVMCVPLWNGDNIVSLVYVENRSKAGCFSKEQMPLLEALADGDEQTGPNSTPAESGPKSQQSQPVTIGPPPEDEALSSPSQRYILHEILGQGGMGIVYRSTDRLTGDIVALKQIKIPAEQLQFMTRVDTETKQNLRLSLAREFQILAGLRHPHIISVLDYGFDTQQMPYFTMSYLPEAQTFLEAGIGLDTKTKVDLLRQLLQALAYLHRRDIIHRDIKPKNVLVAEDRVRVLDFGLSFEQKTGLTSAGGTLLYMAPEIVLSGQPASFASDL